MRRSRFRLTAALLLAGLAPGGCQPQAPDSTGAVADVASDPVLDVEGVRVREGSILQHVSAPGSLVASRESHIGTEVAGRIERILVSEGDRVEQGAPLFQIDREPYALALRQAEAGLDLARAERLRIDADLARARALRAQEIVAPQEIDRLTTARAVAHARERQAGEVVALARWNLDRTLIRAPYAGSVVERRADEGSTALVQPQTIVLVLQETTELEARAGIPESQLSVVRVGDPVLLHLEGLPYPIGTTVTAVSDSVDPATRTYLVRMRVPNAKHELKAGVFAHVEILPQAKLDALVVPREAIRWEDGRTRVLVVRDGRATAVTVRLGVVSEEAAEVIAGLAPDDLVVVGEGAASLAPGMRVRVAERAPVPAS